MADIVKAYIGRINSIKGLKVHMKGKGISVDIHVDSDDPKVRVKEIASMQGQLRAIKKEADLQIKMIKAKYNEAIGKQTYRPGIGGAIFGAGFRGVQRNAAADGKKKLTAERNQAVMPYEQIKSAVDQLLNQLDSVKLQQSIGSK